MKKYATYLAGLLLVGFILISCNKEVDSTVKPLVFKSLIPSSSTFPPGETVQISADVEGTNLTYYWVYSEGSVSGSGATVTYTCDFPGDHKVICTVKDGAGNIADRQLWLHVHQ